MASGTLFLEVWGYDYPCSQCHCATTWVFGLRPWHQPKVGELVTCDKPLTVDVAREILEREGQRDLAVRLRSRPAGARGTSVNPNTCTACGNQAD